MIIFNIKIKDVNCDFRLIKKRVFNKVKLECNNVAICTEIVKKIEAAGFKTAQVGVNHYPRIYGKSKFFNFKRIIRCFMSIISLWYKLILKKCIIKW